MNPTNANPRTSRETESCESDSLFEAESPAVSRAAPNPIIDAGIDPATRLTAVILDHPRSLQELTDRIDALKSELESEDPPGSQYLIIKRTPPSLFSALTNNPDLLKGVRATIVYPTSEILLKMPYKYHEKITSYFVACIFDTLGNMGLSMRNDDFWLGRTGRSTGRVCDKEPDESFYPGIEPPPTAPETWPTLVLETGVSESVLQLRADAQWWYANSSHQTKIVLLVSANINTREANFELWTEVPNPGPNTRGWPVSVLRCTKSARVRDGVVAGDALVIDFHTLMGRPPQTDLETDFELTPLWMKKMCR